MRPEYYMLIIVATAAVLGAMARRGSGSVRQKEYEQEQEARKREAKMKADLARWREYVDCVTDIRYNIAKDLNAAARCLYTTRSKREAAECTIGQIETALAEQDKLGFVTSGSELTVLTLTPHANAYEAEFIKAQQAVHAFVERVRDHVFNLQTESLSMGFWMPDVAEYLQEHANALMVEIEREAPAMFGVTDRVLVDADRDPAGVADDRVTPAITKWRQERIEVRSKIRTDLANAAKAAK